MSKAYNICIIVPSGYQHSHALLEVAMLLKSSLVDLQYTCDIGFNNLDKNKVNIVLGYHLLQFGEELKGLCYIPYQLEQISDGGAVFSENVRAVLANAHTVWDYSTENISFLAKQGIEAQLLPVGYHKNLKQIQQSDTKDIDVLFFGSSGERRSKILNELHADPTINVKALFGLYGPERDNYIARSKIILNIHFYSSKIFEAVRVSYLLNNRCFVVSEESPVYPYTGVEMCLVPYDTLVKTCLEYLKNPDTIGESADRTYQSFKANYQMTALLKKCLSLLF